MTCPHQSQPPGIDTGRRRCAINNFNGTPFLGQCLTCNQQKQFRVTFRKKGCAPCKPQTHTYS